MKRLIFIMIFTFFAADSNPLRAQVNQAVTYFPLKVGNVWVYYCSAFGMNPPCYCVRKYRFQITGTTVKNNKTYFVFQRTHVELSCYGWCYAPPYPDTLRIDSSSGNIYKYSVTGCPYSPYEILFDSLNARLNDTVKNNCGVSEWKYRCRDTSNQNVFGTSRKTKSFNESQFESSYDRTFAQGIGITRSSSPTLSCTQNFSALIGCVLDGILYGDTSMLVGLSQISTEVPGNFELLQNYPNPFNPGTNIEFRIAESGLVRIIVYDALGREVQTLVNQELSPGTYEVDFNGSNLPNGVYYYKLEVRQAGSSTGSFLESKKMVLIK